MKKSLCTKIEKQLKKHHVELSYDISSERLCVNNVKTKINEIKKEEWFYGLVAPNDEERMGYLIAYCKQKGLTFDLKEQKRQEKEDERERKRQEKEDEKVAEKERKRQLCIEFKNNFAGCERYRELDLIPKKMWKGYLKQQMVEGCGTFELDIIDSMVLCKEALNYQAEIERQQKLREGNETWYDKINRNEKGNAKKTLNNAIAFFSHYPKYMEDDTFRWNEFAHLALKKKVKEGIREGDPDITTYETIESYDLTEMDLDMERELGFESLKFCEQSCDYLCQQHSYHPIKEAFERLHEKVKWDGKERLADLFTLVGAPSTKLNRSMTKKYFYGMMKRIWEPGCKFDHMLILYDDTHGTGKTSIIESLFEPLSLPQEENGIVKVENAKNVDKDTIAVLNRCFIAVYDEMAGIIKSDPETLKAFITNTKDTVRLSYGRNVNNFLRHCVFYGSTNTKAFIKDNTDRYERRWWIIDCVGVRHENKAWWDEHFTIGDKLQILAELYEFFMNNPDYNYNELDDDEIEELIKIQQGHWTTDNDSYTKMRLLEVMDIVVPENYMVDYNHWSKYVTEEVARLQYPTEYVSAKTNDFLDIVPENAQKTLDFSDKNDEKTLKNGEKTLKNEHKIPQNWVVWYAKQHYNKVLSANYVTRLVTPEYIKVDKGSTNKTERYWYVKN